MPLEIIVFLIGLSGAIGAALAVKYRFWRWVACGACGLAGVVWIVLLIVTNFGAEQPPSASDIADAVVRKAQAHPPRHVLRVQDIRVYGMTGAAVGIRGIPNNEIELDHSTMDGNGTGVEAPQGTIVRLKNNSHTDTTPLST